MRENFPFGASLIYDGIVRDGMIGVEFVLQGHRYRRVLHGEGILHHHVTLRWNRHCIDRLYRVDRVSYERNLVGCWLFSVPLWYI